MCWYQISIFQAWGPVDISIPSGGLLITPEANALPPSSCSAQPRPCLTEYENSLNGEFLFGAEKGGRFMFLTFNSNAGAF